MLANMFLNSCVAYLSLVHIFTFISIFVVLFKLTWVFRGRQYLSVQCVGRGNDNSSVGVNTEQVRAIL